MGLVDLFNNLGANAKKNAPGLCMAGSIIGIAAVAVLSTWAGYKTKKKIDELKESDEDIKPITVVKKVFPYYIPAAAVAVAASGLSYKGYKVQNNRTAAALTVAYMSKEALARYKERIAEQYGEKVEESIEHAVENEKIQQIAHVDKKIRMDKLNPKELWFVETFSGHVFRSTPEEIKHIESTLNYEFKGIDWLSMNDVLYYFDAPPWECGEYLGWNEGSKIEFKIDHDTRNAVDLNIGGINIKAIKVYLDGYSYRYDNFGDFVRH